MNRSFFGRSASFLTVANCRTAGATLIQEIREVIYTMILQTRSRNGYERCREYLELHYREIQDLAACSPAMWDFSGSPLQTISALRTGNSPRPSQAIEDQPCRRLYFYKNFLVKEAATEADCEDSHHFYRVLENDFQRLLAIFSKRSFILAAKSGCDSNRLRLSAGSSRRLKSDSLSLIAPLPFLIRVS